MFHRMQWLRLIRCLLALAALAAAPALTVGVRAASEIHEHGASGTYPGRVLDEIARHRRAVLARARSGFVPQSSGTAPAVDVGEIAVIPDDGTLVTAPNLFDLDFKHLTFRPAGAGYAVEAGSGGFDAAAATQGTLLNPPPGSQPPGIGDDDSREISIGFSFPFFGESYSTLFINSDGNLTFRAGDSASSDRSLGRILAGPPRIAPYFADLDPSVAGQLRYVSEPGRLVVTWNQVPDYSSFGIGPRETVQVALRADGSIQFSYAGIQGSAAVVAIAPGNSSDPPLVMDFSAAAGQTFLGAAAEVFAVTSSLDVVAVSQRFYQTHEDAYQYLVVFTNFEFSLNGAFAYELNIANAVTGLGRIGLTPTFDYSRDFGSERLESLLNMGNLNRYPADPAAVFLRGVDSTLSVLGQEAGHRFLAYALFRDPETGAHSTELLGRDL
ncbi:MAG TPA: hypothetical protein VNN17_08125, partial [Terriglobia bacterium]|nr:hypothetical protein [Terriglobia bacterium]